MYKLVVFAALLAMAAAAPSPYGVPLGVASPYGAHLGVASPYGAPLGVASPYGASVWGHGLAPAPIIKTAVPLATSYANTVRLASPAVAVAPAPYAAVAHAPVLASPYAHAW